MKVIIVPEAKEYVDANYPNDPLLKALANAMLERLPSMDVEEPPRWIPVTVQLPEEHDSIFARLYGTENWMTGMFRQLSDDVIACYEYGDGSRVVMASRTRDGQWDMKTTAKATVTHWMPLPEAPKEE